MPATRLVMRKIREVLKLHWKGGVTSGRAIARAVDCGRTSVQELLQRAQAAGLRSWEDVERLDEEALEKLLYPNAPGVRGQEARALPDWSKIREQLARRDHHVTLALLWSEYKDENPTGYQYSQFTEHYRRWEKRLSLVMRQNHRAGEKAFVDFCEGLFLTDPVTGARTQTHLFVGALGASSYTFVYAVLSEALPTWIECHVRMCEFFQGVAAITVCDNLRSGVTRADRYEPEINRSYQEWAEHTGTCIVPARPYKPRDKAKAEVACLLAQRWILACLRDRVFYSLSEMNQAIALLLEKLNNRPMRHVKKSRRELWETLDRGALKPLPATRYEFAEWVKHRLNIDYHVEVDEHYYSAPHPLTGQELWSRATFQTVEIFHRGKRVGSHLRSTLKWKYTTEPTHRPAAHREHAEWTPSRLISWAQGVGPDVGRLVQTLIESKPHPEQGYRPALGVIRLEKQFGSDRLGRACARALEIRSPSYRTVFTMLKNQMEDAPMPARPKGAPASMIATSAQNATLPAGESIQAEFAWEKASRENVRGSGYYH
jgi:transposase